MLEKEYELLKKGDPKALEQIYSRHKRLLFWIGKQIITDEFVVECLVQDAFLKLWEYREKIEKPEHIFFFTRLVLKHSCYSHYRSSKNKFFRSVHSLDSYENYLTVYDPLEVAENIMDKVIHDQHYEEIRKILPLLSAERKHLIELCLKYGFRYKAIANAMGKRVSETSKEIKSAIEDVKNLINSYDVFVSKKKTVSEEKAPNQMTEKQSLILKLRFEMKQSFTTIAKTLELSQKEVHNEFVVAYKLTQQNKFKPLNN
ncbi:RNA polymerase sigma factor [Empedobacter falsenii]|uniref:RNA polymerase sigma factor n=1 Tax=Empedobacter falsenii TaxID=343874 RepID=UPI003A802CF6